MPTFAFFVPLGPLQSLLAESLVTSKHGDSDASWGLEERRSCSSRPTWWRPQHDLIDVIEIEESFGIATQVVRAVRVPVIVRLHVPWFLTGEPTQGVQPDSCARRVADERETIWRSASVTASTF